MPIDVRPASEYETLLKSVIEKQPEDALRVLFDVDLVGRRLTQELPSAGQSRLSRGRDVIFALRLEDKEPEDAYPAPKHDVYHIEVQAEPEDGFKEWLFAYWLELAEQYDVAHHRIIQLVAWPLGGGDDGVFRRDGLTLHYRSINVPAVSPARVLSSPLAALALWPKTTR
ncbi:hypothetical protein GCM10010172_69580 [Paractinoplanes ferrugineus]|uniref:Uncharacterized protein n=1 Tax=Paractinoplanes ferrugineus TaxID=113564 RepID=A0A919J272_9ACTN|nr:hypothetical protein [Actinoplanes ferrugineus]GIE12329.1 hypothetical protein Afe05nite_41690 [Actinoplanes ferrugineus]